MNVENRIIELEKKVRSQQRYGMIGVVVAIILIAFAGTNAGRVQEEVKAKAISVVNGKGEPVVKLMSIEDGGAIGIMDNKGEPMVVLSSTVQGGMVSTNHPNGTASAIILTEAGYPAFIFNDKGGNVVYELSAPNATPKLTLQKTGKTIWSTP